MAAPPEAARAFDDAGKIGPRDFLTVVQALVAAALVGVILVQRSEGFALEADQSATSQNESAASIRERPRTATQKLMRDPCVLQGPDGTVSGAVAGLGTAKARGRLRFGVVLAAHGYPVSAPGWPGDAPTVAETRADAEAGDQIMAARYTVNGDTFVAEKPRVWIAKLGGTDWDLAPDGKQIYYVLFPTPNLDADIDWRAEGPRYRDEAVRVLEARGYVGFGDAIEVEHVTTPLDWAARGMERGAPFAAAHSFGQTGPFRPKNIWGDNVVFDAESVKAFG